MFHWCFNCYSLYVWATEINCKTELIWTRFSHCQCGAGSFGSIISVNGTSLFELLDRMIYQGHLVWLNILCENFNRFEISTGLIWRGWTFVGSSGPSVALNIDRYFSRARSLFTVLLQTFHYEMNPWWYFQNHLWYLIDFLFWILTSSVMDI